MTNSVCTLVIADSDLLDGDTTAPVDEAVALVVTLAVALAAPDSSGDVSAT